MSDERDTRDEQAERRLRDWLRAGPDQLPGRALDPILNHAEAHPRRAGRAGLALRRVQVAVRDALTGPPRPVAVLAGVAVLAAAVGLGAWMLRPAWVGPASPLEGWVPASAVDACTTVRYPVQVDATRWVAGRLECEFAATDPRQDGVRSVLLSTLTIAGEDLGTGYPPHDEIYGYGTQRTAGGPWECVFTGQVDDGQRLLANCPGTGANAGLELIVIGTSPDGTAWTYRSWIEPATPGTLPVVEEIAPAVPGATPAPGELTLPDLASGTEACVVVDPGGEERVGDAVHVRGKRVRCDVASSDARIAGTLELVLSSERLDDGNLSTWGTARLATVDGAWAGPFVGAWQPQLDAGSTIARAWLVPEDGGSGQIVLRDEGTPADRLVEAEIRP
jgi:hypothetical protein